MCNENGLDVKLVEVPFEGKPVRCFRLNGIESHRLLSNVHPAADNKSYVVACEVGDEDGPEKIAIFQVSAISDDVVDTQSTTEYELMVEVDAQVNEALNIDLHCFVILIFMYTHYT